MKKITLDGEKMTSRKIAHAYLKEVFDFPDYYGANLDALHDLLTEITAPIHITIDGKKMLVKALGDYGETILTVFENAAAENDRLTLEIKK